MELSEGRLALIAAGATLAGVIASQAINTIWVDAATERETDVQLIQLAVGILTSGDFETESSARIMRNWAVSTINASARVKFDEPTARILIEGGLPDDVFLRAAMPYFGTPPNTTAQDIQRSWDALENDATMTRGD